MSWAARYWGVFSNSRLSQVQLNDIAVHSASFETEHDRCLYNCNAADTAPRALSCNNVIATVCRLVSVYSFGYTSSPDSSILIT